MDPASFVLRAFNPQEREEVLALFNYYLSKF